MNNALKLVLGIALAALVIGAVGFPAQAGWYSGMMGNGIMGSGMMSGMKAMMNGNFDMNAMHRAMHGEIPDVDMNQMHERMLAGNLTQDDLDEMKEHCPMMG